MDEPKLKPQLKLMATYYIGECAGNAEQSAVRAGYSKKYARGNAYKLIARDDVQKYIAYLRYLQSVNPASPILHIATINEIQGFWTNVMQSNKFDIKDRLRASELLGKSIGAFDDTF
ncbi:MAG TPA: hypothetical protein DGE19_01210 [Coprococcus sp.]|jgi:phage terminase small subunit|nr:hypothetical protein [Coprococcus sp.]